MAKRKQAAQSADSAAVYLRLDHAELERLDAFAAALDGDVSRAEAARRLIVQGLDGGSALPEKPRFAPGDRVTTNRHGAGVAPVLMDWSTDTARAAGAPAHPVVGAPTGRTLLRLA